MLVTGGARTEVQNLLRDAGICLAHNPEYAHTQMLESLQIGLREMPANVSACLVVLGDQPQIEHETVEKLLVEYRSGKGDIVVPSYNMKRGHPWLVGKNLWGAIETFRQPSDVEGFPDFEYSIASITLKSIHIVS